VSKQDRPAIFIRSLVLGLILISLWSLAVPYALGFRLRPDYALAQARTIAGICIGALGFALWLACLVQFAYEGRGTLLPIDAPKHLVIGGPYGYVRTPMYLGVATLLFGEAAALAEFSRDLLFYFACLTVVTAIFVRFYEEPTLRKLFGSDYDEYCAHVRRWLPSRRAWTPSAARPPK
jgi:protein-S-isoprenylcysteine O-methyltransferase Ste14